MDAQFDRRRQSSQKPRRQWRNRILRVFLCPGTSRTAVPPPQLESTILVFTVGEDSQSLDGAPLALPSSIDPVSQIRCPTCLGIVRGMVPVQRKFQGSLGWVLTGSLPRNHSKSKISSSESSDSSAFSRALVGPWLGLGWALGPQPFLKASE